MALRVHQSAALADRCLASFVYMKGVKSALVCHTASEERTALPQREESAKQTNRRLLIDTLDKSSSTAHMIGSER
jgi:hypothetical protein